VPEEVAGAGGRDAGRFHIPAHVQAERLRRDRLTLAGEEDEAAVRLDDEVRPGLTDVLRDPGPGSFADRHHTIPAALALADGDRAAFGVDVLDLQT